MSARPARGWWPALLLAVAACSAGTSRAVPAPDVPEEILRWEEQVHELVNLHRSEQRLPRLRYDAGLARIARDHSQAMAEGGAPFSHDRLDWRVGQSRSVGPVLYLGETLAMVRPATTRAAATAVAQWVRSPEHRVVLEGCFDRTGVVTARGEGDAVYVTQLFARTPGGEACR